MTENNSPAATFKGSELRLRCVVEDEAGVQTEYTLLTDNRDKIRYELTAARKGWPTIASEAAMFLFLTVSCWSALKRSGELPAGLDLDKFLDRCVIVEPVRDDAGQPAVESVDPTQPDQPSEPV